MTLTPSNILMIVAAFMLFTGHFIVALILFLIAMNMD